MSDYKIAFFLMMMIMNIPTVKVDGAAGAKKRESG